MSMDYAVGYAKPPRHGQFKPGRTGNPRGRPKGSRNRRNVVADALDEKVEVRIDGKKRRMTKFELMVHTQINKAIKGDTKAFTAVKNLAREYGVQSPNDDQPRGGVLVVPLAASEDEWARLAEEHQRPYREKAKM